MVRNALTLAALCLAVSSHAVSQEYDLGPIPGVEIECLAKSPDAGRVEVDPSQDGSWKQFRRDRKFTGRSPLVGNITCPEHLWTIDLGARKTWISVTPGNNSTQVDLPPDETIGDSYATSRNYEVEGAIIDLDGDGNNRVDPNESGSHKVGEFRGDLPGYERVSCYPGEFPPGTGGDDPLPCFLQNRQNGAWVTVWESQLLQGFRPNWTNAGSPLVGDFDNDGELETAVIAWFEMYLLDMATGTLEQTGVFHPSPNDRPETTPRSYGWFGAFNLDDEPEQEFVILADYEQFISVIGWENGQLVELWDYAIEPAPSFEHVIHEPDVAPVNDIDGDGKPEIVTSIFNKDGDNSWHVVAFDGATGTIELDIPGKHLAALGDVNGDGVAELFLETSTGEGVAEFGPLTVLSYLGGNQSTLWSATNAGFQRVNVPGFPENVNSQAAHYRRGMFLRDDWISGNPVFATIRPAGTGDDVTLVFNQWRNGAVEEIGTATGLRLRILALPSSSPELGVLIESITRTATAGPVTLAALDGSVAYSGRVQGGDGHRVAARSLLTSTIVGELGSDNDPILLTQDFDLTVHAFAIDASNVPQLLWSTPGWGMTSGDYSRTVTSINGFGSLLLADVDGSSFLSPIVASRAADGRGAIKALNADGTERWATSLDILGEPPVWNVSGITNWMAGRFTSHEREDVIVSFRAGKHARLSLLDGADGTPQWERASGGHYSCNSVDQAGGVNMASFDWDGDGLDELLKADQSFDVYDGEDGSILLDRWVNDCPGPEGIFNPGFQESGSPVVGDFLNNGSDQVLYGKNPATMALLELDGDVVWNTPMFEGLHFQTLQGVGDFDGDNKVDILAVGHCGTAGQEVRKYDASNGNEEWTLSLSASCDSPGAKALATGDIDGNGRDEALVVNGNVLHAYAENTQGQGVELWRVTMNPDWGWSEYGDPVIASMDDSGRPQIIVNSHDGYAYGFGTTKPKVTDVESVNSVNANVSREVVTLWGKYDGDIQVQLNDPSTGVQIGRHSFLSEDWGAQQILRVPGAALTKSNHETVGVLATRVSDSLPIIQLKEAASGASVGNLFPWSVAWDPLDVAWVPGIGVATLATRKNDGLMGVELRNADTNTRIRIVYPLGFGWTAKELSVLDVDGTRAIGVLAFRDTDHLAIVQVRDAQDGSLIRNVFPLGLGWTAQELKALPDIDGNNVSEVAVRMTRDTDDLELIQIRDASTNNLVTNVYPIGAGGGGWSTRSFEPMTANGETALAILSTRDSDGQMLVQLKAASDAAIIKNVFFIGPPWDPFGLKVIDDFTGDNTDEIAVLTRKDGDGAALVQVRNGVSGSVIRNLHQTGIN